MILYVQLILIVVLVSILISLYLDERQKCKVRFPTGRLTQFWDKTERRRFVRVNCDVLVRYSLPKGPSNAKAIKTKNISVGGICMSLKEKLAPSTKLTLEIECPDSSGSSNPIIAKGEVVWVKEEAEQDTKEGIRHFTVGIEFKEISSKDRERLFKFIKEIGKIQSE